MTSITPSYETSPYPVTLAWQADYGPRIVFDTDLADETKIASIDVDPVRVLEGLRNDGVPEDVAANWILAYRTNPEAADASRMRVGDVTYGECYPVERVVNIYLEPLVQKYREEKEAYEVATTHDELDPLAGYYDNPEVPDSLSASATKTTLHELAHVKQSYFGRDMDHVYIERTKDKKRAIALAPIIGVVGLYGVAIEYSTHESTLTHVIAGVLAVSLCELTRRTQSVVTPYKVYYNRPSEKEARAAEADVTMPHLVHVTLKE